MFIISDFISAPGWERTLTCSTATHEVIAIRLWDPREIELPDVGPIIMEDAETGEHLYVDTHDPLSPALQGGGDGTRGHAQATFKRAGWMHCRFRPKTTWYGDRALRGAAATQRR